MCDERIRLLVEEHEKLSDLVAQAEDARDSKYNEIIRIVGLCKHCRNWHFPHCFSADAT